MNTSSKTPSIDSLKMLDVLKNAVRKTLENKKKLGHYRVIWRDNKPVVEGEDAPVALEKTETH